MFFLRSSANSVTKYVIFIKISFETIFWNGRTAVYFTDYVIFHATLGLSAHLRIWLKSSLCYKDREKDGYILNFIEQKEVWERIWPQFQQYECFPWKEFTKFVRVSSVLALALQLLLKNSCGIDSDFELS